MPFVRVYCDVPTAGSCRAHKKVEVKKKLVEEQTTSVLTGQNELGEQRKKVRDLQAQLLQIQESKKAAVTGIHSKSLKVDSTLLLC